jgi:alcohol dehydrogenase class IV
VDFEFATAGRILFGRGRLAQSASVAASLGRRALIVTGRDAARAVPFAALLGREGLGVSFFSVAGEPTVEDVRRGLRAGRETGVDLVVALGGGSALDAGKAIGALAPNQGDPLRYLEVVGEGRTLESPGLPCVAIPTTAGTGSEVTRNAVLVSPEHGVKASLRSPYLLPRLAVVDPALTDSVPPDVTAATGLDALTQVLEPFLSLRANPLVDGLCREAIPRAARSLRRAVADGSDAAARDDLAFASLCGGLALANAGLGAVHGLAAPLGGSFPVPHGVACARLLPLVFAANLRTIVSREPDSPVLSRFADAAALLTGRPDAGAEEGVRWLAALVEDLRIPSLTRYGVTAADLPGLAAAARKASSMKANPVVLEEGELAGILTEALQ